MARLVRPALVPAVVAVAVPLALARVSVLAAGLSLLVSVALMVLAMQITRESRRNQAMRVTASQVLGLSRSATGWSAESAGTTNAGGRW
jgi:NO-binding membrane sensor protein with MHYT domain